MSGLPTASQKRTSYENFIAECPWCHKESILNRRSDLPTCEPVAGLAVACLNSKCGKFFWINGDSVNTSHEMLLSDVCELYERKHYMSCILNIAQAYEVFFSLYFRVEILFKPFAAESDMNVEKLNSLGEKLYNTVKRYGFTDMRALFLQHIVKGCSPGNFTEAEMLLSSFPKPQMPTDKAIKAIPDLKLVPLLMAVKNTKVNETRNLVVHKIAYRPTREEADRAYKEAVETLPLLTNHLNLDDDINHYNSNRPFS